jgi:DNA-binding transcriptional LysR family regulator
VAYKLQLNYENCDIHIMNAKNFDLNLLRVFAAVDQARNVSRASAMINLSQPAMSNALARLRKACKDPLFVRTSSGMEPTALALEMAPAVHEALAHLDRALGGPAEFSPGRAQRKFRILMSDAGQDVVLPLLLNSLATKAPGISIESVQMAREHYAETLEVGAADLALGSINSTRAGIYQQVLFHDSYCCVASAEHPVFRGTVTLKQFASARHVVIESGGAESAVQRSLEARHLERDIALSVSQYHTAIETVRHTSLIATVPLRSVGAGSGLQTMRLPVDVAPAQVKIMWHRRLHKDPANSWLRALLKEVFATEK